MSREVVWTNYGLDGAGCFLLLKWLKKTDLEVHYSTPRKFRDDFHQWLLDTAATKYDKIYITSIDLSKSLDIADRPECVVIDTHKSHFERKHLYTDAKSAIVETSSTTRLIFRLFKEQLIKILTPQQIKLISLIDSYVSGKIEPNSYGLNAIYWSAHNGNRVEKFAQTFDKGFNGFDIQQKNNIELHKKKIIKTISELAIFKGVIPVKGKRYNVIATFADSHFPEISEHIIPVYNVDIVMIVNMTQKTVYMHQRKESDAPLHLIAEKLTEGGGTMRTAGGNLTTKFIEFTKTLQQLW